ncbi:delta-lactam-biosynthetic de-N-acetylase [Virgibacillus sp. 179-BFC.A HS]|uniref:Delta-lactam-biosynthetic de-N-acetylase n=1 Tax=Tigheibacillus jepli TaxID=3035914 RepID=A0ABU5CKW5_9BACI|nr:delta-lactam-biosynthetic de-N-acetylase [Virgibacillus sp. 179-BFC.A HS]MDY0406865.1 delta-lactam-biosynthetic de-N-acetylase [Virgibacillus sp. 179-BFC.A HS]
MKKRRSFFIGIVLSFCVLTQVIPSQVLAGGYGWGYKKNDDHQAPMIGKYKDILNKYGGYYVDESGEKTVYLTFDNGYEQGYTDEVLDVLKEEKVPAIFFVTGHYVKSEPELVKRMVKEGHIVGNHSYHHPDFTVISKQAIKTELEDLEKAVAKITDQKEMKYLRPPRGIFSEETMKWTNELGYVHVFWSLAYNDWNVNQQKGWKNAYNQVMAQIHPGAIILLHAVSEDNAKALSHIIKELKKQGYRFKSLDDLVMKQEMRMNF